MTAELVAQASKAIDELFTSRATLRTWQSREASAMKAAEEVLRQLANTLETHSNLAATEAEKLEWADRHDLGRGRREVIALFDDAATLHLNRSLQPVAGEAT